MSLPSELANTLPHLPGVYRMISASNEVLYVGKALDLRKRVTSYFQRSDGLSPRIRLMVSQIAGLEVTITRSESEALLLENNLIKSLSPKFNILFRDDKSYPYLILTNHGFPKLAYFRGNPEKSHHFFGPFPNAGAVRESMQLLQKIFRLRTCDDGIFNHRSRPCLLHQIHRCTAPCVNFISSDEYAKDVHSAMLFLNGEDDGVFERLNRLMSEAADLLKYEDAVIYRDQISALRKVREHQYVSDVNSKDVDVIALASVGDVSCINIVMIRGGRHLGDKNIFPVNSLGMSTIEIVEAFISSHYALIATPKNIIVSEKIENIQFVLVLVLLVIDVPCWKWALRMPKLQQLESIPHMLRIQIN
jgi:excinuclease ABC subunit C